MFSKLKEKLRDALHLFSKKTEEVAEESVEKKIIEKNLIEKKEVIEKKKDTEKKTVKEKKVKSPKKNIWAEEIEKEEIEETDIDKEEQPVSEEVFERVDRLIAEAKELPSEEVPLAYSPANQTFKPDVEKIQERVKELEKERIPANIVEITYFVHGTTTDNEEGKCTGWAPGKLSPLGIQQSLALKDKIKDKHFSVIFSSDLQRAIDSAELTFKGVVGIKHDQRLREANYGDYTLTEEHVFKDHLAKYIATPFPNGEKYIDVERRVASFLNEIYSQYKGKRMAIVAHQAPQLALDVLLKGKSWEQAIKEDWRLKKAWQPGWKYELKGKLALPKEGHLEKREISPDGKKSFFGTLKEKFSFKKEEQKEEGEKIEDQKKTENKKKTEREEEAEKPGFFAKVKEKLTTKIISAEKFDELFWDLELVLLESNVSLEVITKIKEELQQELVNKPLPRDVQGKIEETLQKTLQEILSLQGPDLLEEIRKKKEGSETESSLPYVIAFFGINGAGKTTSIAKLAAFLQKHKFTVVLAAGDTFRAAAIQQLGEHAQKLGVTMISHAYGSDAAAVAYDAIKYAQKNRNDVVLIDTAGRLHSNTNLMAELEKIIRVAKPDLKIFVGESITGNDCIEQARRFNDLVELDGVILTKADVDEKGGAPLSIAYTIKKPILFLGTGQKYEDLEVFKKEKILERLGL